MTEGQTTYVVHKHEAAPKPLAVKLERGQRGSYGWEISAAGESVGAVLAVLREADAALRSEYGARDAD